MNIHKNARTTPQSRAIAGPPRRAGALDGERDGARLWGVRANRLQMAGAVSQRKGRPGLYDRRSAAHRHPHALAPAWLALIRLLRHGRLVAEEIAARLPVARSTVSAVLTRLGVGAVAVPEPTAAGAPLRMGVVLGNWCIWIPRNLVASCVPAIASLATAVTRSQGAGWEYAHVAIDDCSRFKYVEILPDEKRYTATGFLLRALREFRRHGIHVERVLTDNGGAYRSRPFRKVCRWLGIAAKRTRPYRPQTNGKAERVIQTLLRKWAYARPYASSAAPRGRFAALAALLQ